MQAKLIMTWDIAPQHEQEYLEFVINEFMPGLQKIGFKMGDAWVTVFGEYPQILVYVLLPSLQEIRQALQGDLWKELYAKLMEYVVNYSQKVVPDTSSFQF
jgi:hypothetical protein